MTPNAATEDPTLSLFDLDEDTAAPATSGEPDTKTNAAPVGVVLPPTGASERIAHNLTVIRLLGDLSERQAAPAASERDVLRGWAGWGAVPELFDTAVARYAAQRDELSALLSPDGYAAARRSTINAHYTHH